MTKAIIYMSEFDFLLHSITALAHAAFIDLYIESYPYMRFYWYRIPNTLIWVISTSNNVTYDDIMLLERSYETNI